MMLPYNIVVKIVRGGDLHAAGAEFWIYVFVGDDWNRATGEWQPRLFADQILIARIIGMHGHCDVAQHGFWACSGDDQMPGFISERITHMPQVALFLL